MATISWGKPKIFIAPTGAKMFAENETASAGTNNVNVVWELLSTPVEDSTNLTGTQGDKTEATIEGGEAEATKFAEATFELTMNVRMALDTGDVYRYLPDCMYEKIGGSGTDKDNPNHDKYITTNVAVLLIPAAPAAPAFYCPDCSVSIMETYTAADGAMWEITLAPNASTTVKAVQFGQYHVIAQTVSGKTKYMAQRGLADS